MRRTFADLQFIIGSYSLAVGKSGLVF